MPDDGNIFGGGLLGSAQQGQEPQGGQFSPPADGGQQQQTNAGGHPAWNEYLADIPQEFHAKVTPAFEKWDKGVQEKLQKVHSTYEPWKPLLDSGVDPNQAEFAVQLLHSINETPELVYKAIGEFYNLTPQQAKEAVEQGQTGEPNGQQPEINPLDPRISELERQNKIMAQVLLEAQTREQEEQADYELDQELGALEQKYGKMDEPTERIILGLMNSGLSGEDAAQVYFGNLQRAGAANLPKPLIMGSGGGGAPGAGIDPTKLDDKGTKNLVVQMLQAAQRQRQ